MLELQHSRDRQRRLLQVLHERKLDAAVLGLPHHVYWASTHRPFWLQEAAFILFADGRSWLATANDPKADTAADEGVAFEASWLGTQRQEQPAVVAERVLGALTQHKCSRIGIDASAVTSQLSLGFLG